MSQQLYWRITETKGFYLASNGQGSLYCTDFAQSFASTCVATRLTVILTWNIPHLLLSGLGGYIIGSTDYLVERPRLCSSGAQTHDLTITARETWFHWTHWNQYSLTWSLIRLNLKYHLAQCSNFDHFEIYFLAGSAKSMGPIEGDFCLVWREAVSIAQR